MMLVIDLVANAEGDQPKIGKCLDAFVKVLRGGSVLIEPRSLNEFADLMATASVLGVFNEMILVCHANPESFQAPEGTLHAWTNLGTVLTNYFPDMRVALLCGCEAGVDNTLQSLLGSAVSLRAAYGPRAEIGFGQAAYGFMGLIFHTVVNGLAVQDALDRVSTDTGIAFAAAVRRNA
jgi:hypothetical protein